VPLISEGMLLLWELVATGRDIRRYIANVGASSNESLMSDKLSLL
jgi:hypothetical protein